MTQFVELHNFVIFRILQSIVPLLVHQQSPCVSLHNTYWVYTFVYYSILQYTSAPSDSQWLCIWRLHRCFLEQSIQEGQVCQLSQILSLHSCQSIKHASEQV